MDKLVVLAYDLAAVLIILMTIAYSAQRGFATGVVRLIGQLAAFFGAAYLSRWGSEIIYNQFFKTEVTAFLALWGYSRSPIRKAYRYMAHLELNMRIIRFMSWQVIR